MKALSLSLFFRIFHVTSSFARTFVARLVSQCACMLGRQLETRAREMQAQTRISEANESEIHTQATEIELHKTEILNLKK